MAELQEQDSQDARPLILSQRAARRLGLLMSHGVEGTHSMAAALAAAGGSAGAAAPEAASTLPAALLRHAVQLPEPPPEQPSSWQAARDVLAEVAVTTRTLRTLGTPAGTLVEVRNSGRPDVPPHVARLLPLPAPAPPAEGGGGGGGQERQWQDGVAYVAPSLAHNLGLALHLKPLLADVGGDAAAAAALPASQDRISIQRYRGKQLAADGTLPVAAVASLPQPLADAVAVPLAAEVQVAIVRRPEAVLLQMPPPPQHMPGMGPPPDDGGADAKAAAAEEKEQQEEASAAAVSALEGWFMAHPRVVCEGDVLAVPRRLSGAGGVAALLSNLHTATDGGAASSPGASSAAAAAAEPEEVLYFKVMRALPVEPPPEQQLQQGASVVAFKVGGGGASSAAAAAAQPLAVDVAMTAVRLVGSCPSALPAGLDAYLAPGSSIGSGNEQQQSGGWTGDGEEPVWRQLAQLLAAALHPAAASLPLRLAVLLHGPAGSGKRGAAEAAAAAVGAHAVCLSCHDLKAPAGAAEKHTLDGIRAAFGAASEYRPAVLLLRHFQVLGEDSHGVGDAGMARAGAALAECIRRGGERGGGGEGGGGSGQQQQLFPAPVILVACAESVDDVPAPLRRCFTHEFALDAPDQPARQQLLQQSLAAALPAAAAAADGEEDSSSEMLEDSARHTAGLLPRELRAVAAEAAAAAVADLLPAGQVLEQATASRPASPATEGGSGGSAAATANGTADGPSSLQRQQQQQQQQQQAIAPAVTDRHLSEAVEAVRGRAATDIGAPKIPDVRWEDVGGLEDVKRAILDTVELPLKHPELFSGGLRRRSGVLFYGPPGTGKTLLAKAVATECSINFLSVKGPELINMYVGESERQIREVFAKARRARPCVVFFDELDSLAPARGRGSDSGGVMDRVVSQLLAEIDGVQGGSGSNDVFIIGATNRPDLLDPALLRPGRLDKLLYVGIAADTGSRLKVLRALTRKFVLATGVDLSDVAERCPGRFTGADMYALCSDAWMTALRRRIGEIEGGTEEEEEEETGEEEEGGSSGGAGRQAAASGQPQQQEQQQGPVVVSQADFLTAAANLTPSLSVEEVAKYEQIRREWEAK